MSRIGRLPLLGRLAARYAVRHRGQTVRAILGLLVATTVLTTGLGLGESLATSLEREALARFGPIDVMVRSGEPFPASFADRLRIDPRVREHGLEGASTIVVTGAAYAPREEKAEAFATIRGVSREEASALGPIRSPSGEAVPDPRPGETVLSEDLAQRLGARVGDEVVLRPPIPGAFPDPEFEVLNFTGVTGLPPLPANEPLVEVHENALGILFVARFVEGAGPVTVEAKSPSGTFHSNRSASAPLFLLVEPPVEPGVWRFGVSAQAPTAYLATVGVVYPPAALVAGVAEMRVTVAAIAEEGGRSGVTGRPTALVALSDLQSATGTGGRGNTIYYRAPGDADAAVRAIVSAIPEDEREEYRVVAIKAEAIRDAIEAGADVTGFLMVMGGFTLLAAILLAYALFSALVEERRAELGIARALGLTRGEVSLSMTLEGGLYAGLAALAGLALGLGLLWLFMLGFGLVAPEEAPEIRAYVSAGTLVTAFVIGTLIPLGTIGLASLRFARLDPARAIRGIPEDAKGRRRGGVVAAGAIVAAGLLLSADPLLRLVGAPIVAAGVAVGVSSFGYRRLALVPALAGVAWLVWTLYTFTAFPQTTGELDPVLTMARGAVAALILSAVAVSSPTPYLAIGRLLTRKGRPLRASFVALKYLVSRRVPAGLTMAMIALVVVVVTVMGTLFLLFAAQIPSEEGGYDVLGESPAQLSAFPSPLPADVADDVERTDFLVRHFEFTSTNFTKDGRPVGPPWGFRQFTGIDEGFAEGNEYVVVRRAANYATDRDAWDAVARGEAVMLPYWIEENHGPKLGERVTLRTAIGPPREYVVAGGIRNNFGGDTFLAADHVRAMGFPVSTLVMVRTAEGADPSAVAHRLTAAYSEQGITFVGVKEEVDRFAAAAQALILVFEGFLALGLFVGLAATGFLASRAVHERARDIGTLRALGYEEVDIRRAFVLESTTTAGIGLAIGVLVGVTVAHSVWWREIRDEAIPFVLPVTVMVAFTVAVLGLAAWASWRPARRAARLPPALAVRHSE